MYGLRLKDGTRISGLHYKPTVGSYIYLDDADKWYEVTDIAGRIAYARQTIDQRNERITTKEDFWGKKISMRYEL